MSFGQQEAPQAAPVTLVVFFCRIQTILVDNWNLVQGLENSNPVLLVKAGTEARTVSVVLRAKTGAR